jgi:predicted HTH transcriptional regulator
LDRYLETTGKEEFMSNREQLLMNRGLLSGGHPTIAGNVLFGREPQRHLPFAQINAACFPGTESSVDRQTEKT